MVLMSQVQVPFDKSLVLSKQVWLPALGIFVLDQLTKYWVIWKLEVGQLVPVFPFFNLVHYKNRGAAFGMFHNASPEFRMVFFGLVTLVFLGLIVYWLGTAPLREKAYRWGLVLILGGALGNVKDRVIFQEVTDFLDFYIGAYHWPAFNVADSAITVGVCWIMLLQLPWHKWLSKRH